MSAMTELTVTEASRILGLSTATVKRRLVSGELTGRKEIRPQGTRWLVEVDTARINGSPQLIDSSVNGDRELTTLVTVLQEELAARRREISELHVLLQNAQAVLPAPRKPWWMFWSFRSIGNS